MHKLFCHLHVLMFWHFIWHHFGSMPWHGILSQEVLCLVWNCGPGTVVHVYSCKCIVRTRVLEHRERADKSRGRWFWTTTTATAQQQQPTQVPINPVDCFHSFRHVVHYLFLGRSQPMDCCFWSPPHHPLLPSGVCVPCNLK